MAPAPQTAQQRADAARRRERQFRASAREKRARGQRLLACLFERSADAQAAIGELAEAVAVNEGREVSPLPDVR